VVLIAQRVLDAVGQRIYRIVRVAIRSVLLLSGR
jgi:hypothetical protein